MSDRVKTSRTTKDFKTKFKGWDITVPAGSVVSNNTACGPDDNYRFWQDFHKVAKELTGYPRSILAHDLTYYGLNVPAKYCAPYEDSVFS